MRLHQMKNILASVALLSVLASCAMADGYSPNYNQGVVTRVDPVYTEVPARYYETRCQDIYVDRQTSSGDVLAGMIVGGLAGRVIGGNDRGTAAGAVIGGLIAADTRPSRVATRCYDVFVDEMRTRFSHYRVEYVMNGRYYVYDTQERYTPGTRIYVGPTQ
jgi:uncharacterized protein YcfJ